MLLLSSYATACSPHADDQRVKSAQPRPTELAHNTMTTRDAEPTIKTEVTGDSVVVNVAQTTECQETRSGGQTSPTGAVGTWTACGTRAVEGVRLTLNLHSASQGPDTRFSATTDGAGRVTFDISNARSSSERAQLIALLPQGERTSEVALRRTPVRTASNASNPDSSKKAWEQARRDEAASDSTILEQAESALARLEGKREAWGESEIDLMLSAMRALNDVFQRAEGSPEPRLSSDLARMHALDPAMQRALALQKQRQAQQVSEQAKRDDESLKQLRPKCIDCCHITLPEATHEHCEVACKEVAWEGGSGWWGTGYAVFTPKPQYVPTCRYH